ncbi:hypothetical protein [Falsihalocynthiibacter arcticus]|uniref:Uncharacterized protein n=1 Tax=Falsihalocynthiibacter arcticus TaxID=1579316 RepID=A0A126V1U3_9RHOB|nr:hypothetical protein [Falsihalocynthiibacter arcticus]AML51659.1 hypothetical protein RC74_10655 [Falsihalocynthiibacter arcticus]
MDESEKNKIVSAYFAAAEAMVALGELASGKTGINVVPFAPVKNQRRGANVSTDDASLHKSEVAGGKGDVLSQVSNRIRSTKTGTHAFADTIVSIQPGYLKIGGGGKARIKQAHWCFGKIWKNNNGCLMSSRN